MFYGIDIGGSKIELAAFDHALSEHFRLRVDTPAHDYSCFLDVIGQLIHKCDHQLGVKGAIGIGLPGVTDRNSGCQLSSNVPALSNRPVHADLQAKLGRPVALGNDCLCFALSEAHGGAADGYASMFGAILGTGAGGGYCLNGRLITGLNGLAGEWGHGSLPVTLQQRYRLPLYTCGCGLVGCLECYVSGRGITNLSQHLSGRQADAKQVVAWAEEGDIQAQQTLACHLDILAYGLAGLVLHYDPHVIVLGGGLSHMSSLYRDLPGAVEQHLFTAARVPPIVSPRFGAAAGARGAAILAMQYRQLGS